MKCMDNEVIVSQVWFDNANFPYHCQKIHELLRKQTFKLLCPVALHTALNRFMSIFQIALILRAV